MGKVSVGLRGWRFEESDIFDENGEFKPLEEIPEDPRQRLLRLCTLVEKPCDACYLIHGDEDVRRCRPAAIVYGEPMGEVVLCSEHEPDFIYWYQHEGGKEYKGEEAFGEAFHDWFEAGGRAPESFGPVEHVETDPDELPEPPGPEEVRDRLMEEYEPRRIDLRQYGEDSSDDSNEGGGDSNEDGQRSENNDEPLDESALEDVDLSIEYPKTDE